MRYATLLGAGIVALAMGCKDAAIPSGLALLAVTPGKVVLQCTNEASAVVPCPDPNSSSPSPSGSGRSFGSEFPAIPNVLYQAADDPHEGADGIWLGPGITPWVCWADLGASIVDADRDWLDDNCELHLARAFAPTWNFEDNESCWTGEPVWGAKYFSENNVRVVRIAYMPAYYNDCGPLGSSHRGDIEMVMVQIIYNSYTQHWEFERMWTSAHYDHPNDGSRWAVRYQAKFTLRPYAHPLVYVARSKHANYPSLGLCEEGGVFGSDMCTDTPNDRGRFPVRSDRNIGSHHTPLLPCPTYSMQQYAGNGKGECFYPTPGEGTMSFCGWRHVYIDTLGNYVDCSSSYLSVIHNRNYDEITSGRWGPGPGAWYPPEPPGPGDPPVGCFEGCEPQYLRAAKPVTKVQRGYKKPVETRPGRSP